MRTLVIHPYDPTTCFLEGIYENKKWSVIRVDIPEEILCELIKAHDRIIMLGHGTPDGLIGTTRMIVNDRIAKTLQDKVCVCIWCNADIFVFKHNLSGFCTGMFISEEGEAMIYDVDSTLDEIYRSNVMFSRCVKSYIDKENMVDLVKKNYIDKINPRSEVVKYNKKRIYKT